ncbi:polyunsaturated fatty acid lipoxygenase ALOX15B-like [Protopterus annectens]|uniref:polyunsaturated fatty acid lipoxygenase ALOX15B-like n=1 Tax=Protopterus annectens TaxID=7888 RepID=UPI001CF93DAE|nr:polyunsaturated fatty acid lipoxygenase ALOX15B-like [Protopterus annectens]
MKQDVSEEDMSQDNVLEPSEDSQKIERKDVLSPKENDLSEDLIDLTDMGRHIKINERNILQKYSSCNYEDHFDILVKAFKLVTYESLCLPDDLENRGVKDLKNYYYKEDGMLLWNAINEFVGNFVDFFYKTDNDVKKDSNLQDWVKEIFQHGFLERKASGIPSSLESKPAFKKYLTMVIFTCSAQHAAMNNGQFDIFAWVPNSPNTMRKPPPKRIEDVTEALIVQTLPEINVASRLISIVYQITYPGDDFVSSPKNVNVYILFHLLPSFECIQI